MTRLQVSFSGEQTLKRMEIDMKFIGIHPNGEMKAAGLGRGRNWNVMPSHQRPQPIPEELLELKWACGVVPNWDSRTRLLYLCGAFIKCDLRQVAFFSQGQS